jgi:hypothetical protein
MRELWCIDFSGQIAAGSRAKFMSANSYFVCTGQFIFKKLKKKLG